jgi:hypothetical protein
MGLGLRLTAAHSDSAHPLTARSHSKKQKNKQKATQRLPVLKSQLHK